MKPSLRNKLLLYVGSLVAASALMFGGEAKAETNKEEVPKNVGITRNVEQNLIDFKDFQGKSFDERMVQAEKIVQQYNLDNQAQFSNIFGLLLKEASKDPANLAENARQFLDGTDYQMFDDGSVSDAMDMVLLGRLSSEIDPRSSDVKQLEDCGFDLLVGIANGNADMSNLSDQERAAVFAQYDVASRFFHIPNLMDKILQEDKGRSYPVSDFVGTINGHKIDGDLYELSVARKASALIRQENSLNLQQDGQREQ